MDELIREAERLETLATDAEERAIEAQREAERLRGDAAALRIQIAELAKRQALGMDEA